MTDRLTTLLHAEATGLDVPPAPVDAVLTGGRALRRRRRTASAVVGAAAAVAVVAAGVALLGADRADRDPEPAKLPDDAAYQQLGAWARGDEIHVGNHTAVVQGVEKLRYTSAGVLVETEDHRQVLVEPDGQTRDLDLDLTTMTEDFGPTAQVATDATEPYVAYVRMIDDTTGQLTVRDLDTGDETAVGQSFPAPDRFGTVYSLWGDQVYFIHGQSGRLVDWRTGDKLRYPKGPRFVFGGYGHGVVFGVDDQGLNWVVSSRTEDATLLTVPVTDPYYGEASLSPDGRYLAAATNGDGFDVYDIAAGTSVHLGGDRDVSDYGWTPDGHLVGKELATQKSEVEVCDPVSGACHGTGTVVGSAITVANAAISASGF